MNPYTALARKAVETYIKKGKIIQPPLNLPKSLIFQKAGVFVSIYKIINNKQKSISKNLRGCIGTFLPTCQNIAWEIIKNAISAATADNRFYPIRKEELPHLSYSVDVLEDPIPAQNISELNPKKYGIIVFSKNKIGLLLPDIETIKTPQEQIRVACQKAGIQPQLEKIKIFKFQTKRYKEEAKTKKL